MSETKADVARHYTIRGLGDRILSALGEAGKDLDALTLDDLAPVDAFHIRGRVATEELLALADLKSTDALLDVGSGLGGTSRYLAAKTGCRVTGVDLTEEYCRVAEMLSDRVGLGDRTRFQQGSALALPFEDDSFDVVWTEHVQMNIADKSGFYEEIARVLRPGGQFVFHDILAGPGEGFDFPVPWAGDASISHLISVTELQALLSRVGFAPAHWEDKSAVSAEFFSSVIARVQKEGWAPLGLHLLLGSNAADRFANLSANLQADRLRVVQAVMTRVG